MKFRGDRQIAIYTATEARSASGDVTDVPVLYLSSWADVKETGGTESEEQDRTTAEGQPVFLSGTMAVSMQKCMSSTKTISTI